jgi:hypothetical protein
MESTNACGHRLARHICTYIADQYWYVWQPLTLKLKVLLFLVSDSSLQVQALRFKPLLLLELWLLCCPTI